MVRRNADNPRFWEKVQGGHVEECWLWTAARSTQGYGLFGGFLAHRIAYEMLRGEIPANLFIDHLCSNPPCVNPWHLEPVSARMNSARSADRGRARNTPRMNPFQLPRGYMYSKPVFVRAVEWAIDLKDAGDIDEITPQFMQSSGHQSGACLVAAMSWLAHLGYVDEKWKRYDEPRPDAGIVQVVPDRVRA